MKTISKISGLLLIIGFSFLLGWQFSVEHNKQSELEQEVRINPEDATASLELFKSLIEKDVDIFLLEEVLEEIEKSYVDEDKIVAEEISYGLAKGLVYSLKDPYSTYMTPEESNDFQDDMDGSLEGIGAELNMQNGKVVVVSPLKESPAAQAGLLPQDIILAVDDEEIGTQSLFQVVKKIRGESGTMVKLSVIRGEGELLDININRARITIESVELEMRESIAIIAINNFGTNTKEEFERYLTEAILSGAEGIVLDLRFNPGGYLDKAVDIVSAFMEDGKVVSIKSKGDVEQNLFVSGNKRTDLPLVVLQNGGSASASEIVAGALQDTKRAIIVGENSFGKGTVQEVIPLRQGGKLKLTISHWYTPNGRGINEKGIAPDVLVENSTDDYKEDRDPQMDKAIEVLKETLTNN